ncbi:hypothetical protein GGR57DRAFT_267151 [Xylariaceae sp. FL1272]|nr:hypothetical protein GGR57DRAFT_267151 [Xylariaceae sp. FL1272]
MNTASPLVPFKNALSWIHEWQVAHDGEEEHHQFTMDLDLTIKCCFDLVNRLESYINGFPMTETRSALLYTTGRWKVAQDAKLLLELQTRIDRQTNALSLLLTAFRCESLKGQRSLLLKPRSREVFGRMREETASLLVQYDQASFLSCATDSLSKLSWVFDFDSEVQGSALCQKVSRALVKTSLKRFRGNKDDSIRARRSSLYLLSRPERQLLSAYSTTENKRSMASLIEDDSEDMATFAVGKQFLSGSGAPLRYNDLSLGNSDQSELQGPMRKDSHYLHDLTVCQLRCLIYPL